MVACAEGLAQQQGQLLQGVHLHVVFGHRLIVGPVMDFLIGVAIAVGNLLLPGEGDHRGVGQPGLLQTGGQVARAHGLGQAHRWLAGDAGHAVGHVGGRLFRVGHDALDAHLFQEDQGLAQDRLHIKDMGDAVTFDGLGQDPGSIGLSLRRDMMTIFSTKFLFDSRFVVCYGRP